MKKVMLAVVMVVMAVAARAQGDAVTKFWILFVTNPLARRLAIVTQWTWRLFRIVFSR